MLGPAFALVFALLFGFASIFSRRGLETGSYRSFLVISLAVGSPIFLVMTGLTTGFANTPMRGVGYAAAGAVFGSVLARSLYVLGINYLGPGKALSINATSPVYAAFLAWVVLEETITPRVVIGTLAVVLSNGDASIVTQIIGIVAVGAFAFIASLIVWFIIKAVIGVRVDEEGEEMGLDKAECGMEAYPEFGTGSQRI